MENKLPERINAIRVVTYDVSKIVKDMSDDYPNGPTFEDVLGYVQDLASEDLSCHYGHVYDMRGVTFQDENGKEL